MKKKNIGKIVLGILLFVVLVFLIPLGINQCYQSEIVIIPTKWGAADVLSYYGTLLGASVTILTLIFTILFTRKQIQRERFLERNRLKWETVDTIIMQALLEISPLNLCGSAYSEDPVVMVHGRISELQSYAITAKTFLDKIKFYINLDECNKQMGDFIAEIFCAITQFCQIESDLEKEYMTLLTIAVKNNNNIPNEELVLHFGRTEELMKKIPIAYNGPYQRLLNMKRDVFEKVYADIDAQADSILRFARKRQAKRRTG